MTYKKMAVSHSARHLLRGHVPPKGGILTATALRSLLGADATVGVGSAAGRSLQDQFDGAVSCLRAASDAYRGAVEAMEQVRDPGLQKPVPAGWKPASV